MAHKINGEGDKQPIPIIQPYGESIICRRCGGKKIRYMVDFPYCYECYREMLRRGEMSE